MKTKQIPAIVMLLAGLIICVIGFIQHWEMNSFLKTLLIVLLLFLIIGGIVKLILDPFFKEEEPGQEETSEGEADDGQEQGEEGEVDSTTTKEDEE